MESDCYLQLQPIISQFPRIHQFLDDGFIREQCESGLKNFVLKRADNHEGLLYLDNLLAELTSVLGYDRLGDRLKMACSWDEYQEFLAQMDITLWFKDKDMVKEIEPKLANAMGKADILLTFSQQDIYCEVTSRESLEKSIESKRGNDAQKVQNLLKKEPWMTQQDAENEIEIDRILRVLLRKTSRQLPANHPGILALDGGKGAVYVHKIKRVAEKLLPQRRQMILIMLWSLERGTQIGEPPFCFLNQNSQFPDVGQELLNNLGRRTFI